MEDNGVTNAAVHDGDSASSGNELSASDVRNHSLFKEVCSQVKELRGQLDAIREEKDKSEQQAKTRNLEEEGKYQEILADRERKINELTRDYEKKILDMSLRTELVKNGAVDEFFIRGVLASYDSESGSVADYVASIVSEHGAYFGQTKVTGQPGTGVAAPSRRANTTDWDSVRANLKNRADPQASKEAARLLQEYYLKHGEMPK